MIGKEWCAVELHEWVFDVGGILVAPVCGDGQTRASEEWITRWEQKLLNSVGRNDGWGLLMERPDGEVFLFDCTLMGIARAARYGTRAAVILQRRP